MHRSFGDPAVVHLCYRYHRTFALNLNFLYSFFTLKFDDDCKDASEKTKNYWINVKHYLQWQHRVPPPIPHRRVIWMISMEWKLRTKECWRWKLQLIGASIHLNVVFIVCKVISIQPESEFYQHVETISYIYIYIHIYIHIHI